VVLTDKGGFWRSRQPGHLEANKKVLAKFDEQDLENLRKFLYMLNEQT
jgi:hypothetical protein